MNDERPHPYFDQHCPTCGSPVRVERAGVTAHIAALEKRVAELEAAIAALEKGDE